jgi:protoporphyrinogen/coproporphyrinogen III oxidase
VTATFVGGMRDPVPVAGPESQLVRIAHGAHQRLLGASGEPAVASVMRWPAAIPQAEMGHAERIGMVEHLEAQQPGLHVTGSFRNGAAVGSCWAEGRRVARQVLARTGAGGRVAVVRSHDDPMFGGDPVGS